jgi:hypothetical protein
VRTTPPRAGVLLTQSIPLQPSHFLSHHLFQFIAVRRSRIFQVACHFFLPPQRKCVHSVRQTCIVVCRVDAAPLLQRGTNSRNIYAVAGPLGRTPLPAGKILRFGCQYGLSCASWMWRAAEQELVSNADAEKNPAVLCGTGGREAYAGLEKVRTRLGCWPSTEAGSIASCGLSWRNRLNEVPVQRPAGWRE